MTMMLLGFGSRCLAAILVVVVLTTTSSVAADVSYQCTLSDPIEIDDGVTLEHVKNVDAGTYTMRLTYTGGQSWIGIGTNTDGNDKMTPGTCVIGRVLEDGSGSTSVQKYSLQSDAKDGSGVVPMQNQNLMDTSFVQTDDGTSTLQFTQLLSDDDGVTITDESTWIYAIGLPDNQWEGKHKIHGAFTLSLKADGCVVVTTKKPTPSPTRNPTKAPTTTTPVAQEGQQEISDLVSENDNDNDSVEEPNTPDEEQQQEDEAFEQDIQEEEEEDTTTTSSSTVFVNPTSTSTVESTSTTTTSAAATGGTSTGSASSSGFIKKQDVTEETHGLWKAHGWTLTLAWGFFAPLAVGASVLRHTVGRFATSWYNLHFYLNLLVVALTLVGFALAVAATQQEDKPHFQQQQDDTNHHPIGLVITLLVVGQCLWGYFRPPAPTKPSTTSTSTTTTTPASSSPPTPPSSTKDNHKHIDDEEDITGASLSHSFSNAKITHNSSSWMEDSDDDDDDDDEEEPTTLALSMRKIWEMQHRLTGVCIVAMAWYNCHSGYQLMEENYDETDNHTTLFWSVTGTIATMIFVLSYGIKMR